jgi:hypothetical protein
MGRPSDAPCLRLQAAIPVQQICCPIGWIIADVIPGTLHLTGISHDTVPVTPLPEKTFSRVTQVVDPLRRHSLERANQLP